MSNLMDIPVKQIRQNKVALRDVDKKSEDYVGLVDSIKNMGVLNPISVREFVDPDTKEKVFSIIDGLHRWSASVDAGKDTIPAIVLSMQDAMVLKAQLIANVQKVETKPVEYSKQLVRILGNDPILTLSALAADLGKSPQWLSERLSLTKLTDPIAKLVDEGKINLSNGYVLAKLPPEEQPAHIESAMTMSPQEFGPKMLTRKKEIDKARREGRDPAASEVFTPAPFLQKTNTLKDEFSKPNVGPQLVKALKLDRADSKTEAAERGFAAGIAWTLHMDPLSIEVQKKEHEAHVASIKQKKDAAATERAKRKSEAASLTAARAQVELEARTKGEDVEAALKAFDDAHAPATVKA